MGEGVHAPVSVVVPVRGESARLGALLDSLAAQTFVPDEIIVVDGGSTDATVQVARSHTASQPYLRVIEAGPATPGRGRNVGINAARNEVVALTDAGVRAEPIWLEELVRALERRPDASVVYGNYEPVTDSYFTRCAALAYVAPKQTRDGGALRGPSTASMLIRRAVWREVGGFPDLRAAEDLIFMERVSRAPVTIAWAPRATVWWQLRGSFASTFRRFATYSRHNVWLGRQRDWHYGIARQYLVAALVLLLAALHDPRWLVALPLGLLARTLKSVWVRRAGDGVASAFHPTRLLGVLLILLTIDAATFIGWAQAVVARQPSKAL